MTTKLTLSIDDAVVRRIKRYARKKGRSVSELVENHFRLITSPEEQDEEELTASVRSLMGSIKAPKGFDYKKALAQQKKDRHG